MDVVQISQARIRYYPMRFTEDQYSKLKAYKEKINFLSIAEVIRLAVNKLLDSDKVGEEKDE